jgi:PAS domain S-box-containing protein
VGSVLETLNQGVIISDKDRRIIFANSMFLEMGKMSVEDILGRSVMDLYPADEAGRLQEFIARREAEGRAQYEFYIPRSDGGRLPVEVTSRLVYGADGRGYGIITATDISDQKRIQAELGQTNALLLERHLERCVGGSSLSTSVIHWRGLWAGHPWRRPPRCCRVRCIWSRYQLSARSQPHLLRDNGAD